MQQETQRLLQHHRCMQVMMRLHVMLIYVLLFISADLAESIKARRTISFQDMNLKQFKESDFGLSSLMVRDDIGLLVLGVRGRVLTLSLDDITQKTSEVKWTVSSEDKIFCQVKGKSPEDCDNYIRLLHTMEDGKMLVCGTNAFNPACDSMTFTSGNISLERKTQEGRGKVPFDPNQRFASLLDGNTLYSATSSNFLGSEMVFQRHGLNPVKTETKHSWLNEPTMISINMAEVSRDKQYGEDDNVFLFFTEGAVEEHRGNILVSRIARSDLGGKRTLQNRWTSFLKARLDCPFGDVGSPALVQDVFLLQDQNNLRESIFYATFTSNPEPSSLCSQSAVCAYKLSDISQVFKGTFLTESDTGSWNTHTGEEPFPYPASCIDNEMRDKGVITSLNLSDTTLLFVKNHPLMEGVVTPIAGKPLLVQTMTRFSKIVVDQVTSTDGQKHQIIFIGTDSGWLQKAVKFDGEEGRVIEELQLFKNPQPVDFLQLSSKTGQLYSGSKNGAVQVDVKDCSRYTSCNDCLLARDPYCGWDQIKGQCASVARTTRSLIQSLSDGDIRICSTSDLEKEPIIVYLAIDIAQFLPCSPEINLPVSWRLLDNLVHPGPRHTLLSQGLIIRPSSSDGGLYTCETVEAVKGRMHREVVIQYLVKVQDPYSVVSELKGAVFGVAVFAGLLAFVILRQLKEKKLNRVGCGS
ncbi:semaphorin-4E-like isoform X2 [Melanotaenia boesemani]|uniref:semaphorin-4E-like isoform X2 n=1 Tax=Melanotaenia boesemani TaxID=1250792 RepID=UPI001C05EAC4|nr:semaphorin-4E-like isoform X2 [Melanotaenia boesemani]